MSFDVVAASREEAQQRLAAVILDTGLQFGLDRFSLAVVGILAMFNNRPIIVGLLTLGYATLGLLFSVAGILVAWRASVPLRSRQIAGGGAVAGTVAGALMVAAAAVMSMVNLRSIFVSLDKPLLDMLTFQIQPRLGYHRLARLLGALLGAAGALARNAPGQLRRRSISGGLIAAGLAGLFQELIRPVLANSTHDQAAA